MSTSKSGGCGCGGAGCGCDTGMCTDQSFKRPRFFAGQLLTEDDLQALTDYVVGKNRLHNRYLFGAGVVCGLGVTCHPCGGGTVMVGPGFALDCCGNDLVLPCAEEVDVQALLRDLRKRQMQGYECSDPCEDKGDRRTYGLYLTYKETPSDPVAPYDSGDPCGRQACEPTRICEGFGFELRCECTQERQAELYLRILACIGDVKSATSAIRLADDLYRYATGGQVANRRPERDEMREKAVRLKTWLLTRLEQAGSRTRCDLYDRARAVRLARAEPDAAGREAESWDAEAERWLDLVRILLEYLIDCVCLALNPPCAACDDSALLLACVELDGCDVVDICNMSRRFVLSPAAMRYWLPVSLLGDLLKRFCCNLEISRLLTPPEREAAPAADAESVAAANVAPDTAMSAARTGDPRPRIGDRAKTALESVGIRSEGAILAADFSASLADLAARVGGLDEAELRVRGDAIAVDLGERLRPVAARAANGPVVREAVTAVVKEEVAAGTRSLADELRPQIESNRTAVAEIKDSLSTVEARTDMARLTVEIDRRVGEVLKKELAATKLNAPIEKTNVVKNLMKENERLRTAMGKLSEKVGKLGGKT